MSNAKHHSFESGFRKAPAHVPCTVMSMMSLVRVPLAQLVKQRKLCIKVSNKCINENFTLDHKDLSLKKTQVTLNIIMYSYLNFDSLMNNWSFYDPQTFVYQTQKPQTVYCLWKTWNILVSETFSSSSVQCIEILSIATFFERIQQKILHEVNWGGGAWEISPDVIRWRHASFSTVRNSFRCGVRTSRETYRYQAKPHTDWVSIILFSYAFKNDSRYSTAD